MSKRSDNRIALRAAVYYFIAGSIWIFATDLIFGQLAHSISELSWVQTVKGSFFVLMSATFVFIIFKRLAARASSAESLRVIGQAAATIVHDLRNQVHVIKSGLDLYSLEDSSDDERTEYKRLIDDRIESMLSLSQDILDFSRGNLKISCSAVNLSAMCENVITSIRPVFDKRGVSLKLENSPAGHEPVTIMGDAGKLERAIINLLSNSLQACTSGDTAVLRLQAGRDKITLEVEDSGSGVPEQLHDKLFEPFVTFGKDDGTGLGLAIVKTIVEFHKGEIAFVPVAKGALFRITLPPSTQAEASTASRKESASKAGVV